MPKKDVDTRLEGIRVHLTWPKKDNNITVIGTAIHASDGIRVDGIQPIRHNAKTKEDIEFAQSVVVNKITEKIELKQRQKAMAPYEGKHISYKSLLVKTFLDLFGADIDTSRIDNAHIIHPWAPSTQKACVTYFFRNILPQIQDTEIKSDFSAVEKEDLIKCLTQKALKRMENKEDIEEARNIAVRHMNDADRIYSEMRYHEPSLPAIDLRCDVKRRRKKTEQLKRLPFIIHKKFRELVEMAIAEEPYMARAAVLMDSAGARSGEAAATWFGWHIDYGEYMVVKILSQEEKGKRIDRLKSKDAYRCVVLDEWGTVMVRKCNNIIGKEALTEESPIIDTALSAWVRSKLREAGCTDDYLREAYMDMELNPEYTADGKPIRDIAAHICRRNRASIWRNYCGYTQEELDYCLGHKNVKKRFEKENPLAEGTFKVLAQKNSHYDMFPSLSISPKHRPIALMGEESKEIPPFDEVRIQNTSDYHVIIKIDALAMEAGETIVIDMHRDGVPEFVDRTVSNRGKRMNAYIVGTLQNEKEKDLEGEYEQE